MTRKKSDGCERRYLQALGSEHSILIVLTWLGRQHLYLLPQPCPVSRVPRGHLPMDDPPPIPPPPSQSQLVTLPCLQMVSSMCPHPQVLTDGASAVSLKSACWPLLKGPPSSLQHLSSGFSQLASYLHPAATLAFMEPDVDHVCSCSKTFHSSPVPSEVP